MWTYSTDFYDASFYGPHGYEANNMTTRVWIAPDAFMYDDYGDAFLFVAPDTGDKYLEFDFGAYGLRPELVIVEPPQHPVFDGWLRMLAAVGFDQSPRPARFLLHNFAAQRGWTDLAAHLPEVDAEYQEIGGEITHALYVATCEKALKNPAAFLAVPLARRAAWMEKYRQVYQAALGGPGA